MIQKYSWCMAFLTSMNENNKMSGMDSLTIFQTNKHQSLLTEYWMIYYWKMLKLEIEHEWNINFKGCLTLMVSIITYMHVLSTNWNPFSSSFKLNTAISNNNFPIILETLDFERFSNRFYSIILMYIFNWFWNAL